METRTIIVRYRLTLGDGDSPDFPRNGENTILQCEYLGEESPETPATPARNTYIVATTPPKTLTVRSRPSANGSVLDGLSAGREVEEYARAGSLGDMWIAIDEAQTRWVSMSYLTPKSG